jgi:putative transposase
VAVAARKKPQVTTETAEDGVVDKATLDALMAQVESEGLELLGPNGVLREITKRVMEAALDAERTDHLGYERGDPAGRGSGNSRNGTSPKRVLTDAGDIDLDVPRDRAGTFEPKLVPKNERRLSQFNELICGLVAKGMSVRDVQDHLHTAYGVDISPELVSKITDAVLPEMREWQNRQLDPVYPILYLDAIVVKVREDGAVINKAVHIALGVDLEGRKNVLGMWLERNEGAKFWLSVLTEIKNRGVNDVLIVCTDGLTGFGDAIEAVWPKATVQTCVVHLIRNSMKFVNYKERTKVIQSLRPIYAAPTVEAAAIALDAFEAEWGKRYPAIVALWHRNWERFIPFLAFDAEIRKIIYTTNAIESLNYQLRKITKTKGHFPTDDSVLKLLYMGIRNIGSKRSGAAGTGTREWQLALNAFAIAYPDRITL